MDTRLVNTSKYTTLYRYFFYLLLFFFSVKWNISELITELLYIRNKKECVKVFTNLYNILIIKTESLRPLPKIK